MKLAARICSMLLTLLWLLLAGLVIFNTEDPMTPGGRILLACSLVGCAGLLVAWRRPVVGGGIGIAVGLAYALVNWIANADAPPLPLLGLLFAGPFVLTGLLFIAADRRSAGAAPASGARAGLVSALVVVLVLALLAFSLGLGVSWPLS